MHCCAASIVAVSLLAGCARMQQSDGEVLLHDSVADVEMRSSSGELLGVLHFAHASSGGARLAGTLTGLPVGTHGIHVHETGRCEAPSFETAGAHFNPMGKQHGLENPSGWHAGDAPNIVADALMRASVDLTFANATLRSTETKRLLDADGSAVVIHAAPDDQKSDPSGNSGARIACGIVRPR